MVFIIEDTVMITTNEDNVKKNMETLRKFTEEPYKSQVYWLRAMEYKGLKALLAQQELLAIQHMRDYMKSTKSKLPVEWKAYDPHLMATHRDTSGKWC